MLVGFRGTLPMTLEALEIHSWRGLPAGDGVEGFRLCSIGGGGGGGGGTGIDRFGPLPRKFLFFSGNPPMGWAEAHPEVQEAHRRIVAGLGESYAALALHPGIVHRIDEFLAFAARRRGPLAAEKLLETYSRMLGTVTLYRSLQLYADEAAVITSEGMSSNYLREFGTADELTAFFMREGVTQPVQDHLGERLRHSPFLSGTERAEYAAFIYYVGKIFRGAKPNYIYRLTVPVLHTIPVPGANETLVFGAVAPDQLSLERVDTTAVEHAAGLITDEEYRTRVRSLAAAYQGVDLTEVSPVADPQGGSAAASVMGVLGQFLPDIGSVIEGILPSGASVLVDMMKDLVTASAAGRKDEPAVPTRTVPSLALRLRPTTVPSAEPVDIQKNSGPFADRVEIAGRFVEFLYQLEKSGDQELLEHWEKYLDYAELADPESAARVYGRLLDLARDVKRMVRGFSGEDYGLKKEDYVAQRRWRLAVSLHQSGYLDESDEMFRLTTPRGKLDFAKAVKAGLPDRVRDTIVALSVGDAALFQQARSSNHEPGHNMWCSAADPHRDLLSALIEVAEAMAPADTPAAWLLKTMHEGIDRVLVFQGCSLLKVFETLEKCLASPPLFRPVIRRIIGDDAIDTRTKVKLLAHASSHLPPDLADGEREALAEAYLDVVAREETRLRDRGFHEDNFYRPEGEEELAAPPDFSHCHFYWEHTTRAAALLLGCADPRLKGRGLRMLDGLTEAAHPFANQFKHADPRIDIFCDEHRTFRPSLWKGIALVREVDAAPPGQRERMLRQASSLIPKPGDGKEEDLVALHGLIDLARQTTRYGFGGSSGRVLETINMVPLHVPDHGVVRWDDNVRLREEWDKLTRHAHFQSGFLSAVQGSAAALGHWLDSLQSSEDQGRPFFRLEDLIAAIEFFEQASALLGVTESAGVVMRLGRIAVEHHVASVGGRGEDRLILSEHWAPLVKTFRNESLPLSAAQRDEFFAYLIEQATPRKGLTRAGVVTDPEKLWDGFKLLDFVLGNRQTPRAERLLLERLADVARGVYCNRADPRFVGVIKGLHWVFNRVAPSGLLDAALVPVLKGLKSEVEYAQAVARLALFREGDILKIDRAEVESACALAVSREDLVMLRHVQKKLQVLITQEMDQAPGRSDRTWVKSCLSVEGTLLERIYTYWREALPSPNRAFCNLLLETWLATSGREETDRKKILLYRALADAQVPLEAKRQIFSQLSETEDVSPYAKTKWEQVVQEGGAGREMLFYEVFSPVLGRSSYSLDAGEIAIQLTTDLMLALVFERIPFDFDREGLISRYAHHKKKVFKIDAHDPEQWLFLVALSSHPRGELNNLFTLLASRSFGVNYFSRRQDRDDPTHYLHVWPQVQERARALLPGPLLEGYFEERLRVEDPLAHLNDGLVFSSRPGVEEALLLEMPRFFNVVEAALDRAWGFTHSLPPALTRITTARGGRLTDFLVSRLFARMESGRQQRLLSKIEALPADREGEVLGIFFKDTGLEKAGQTLSYWPEVPEPVQKDLRPLQDRVPPTHFAVVVNFLKKEFGIAEDHELIQNLRVYQEQDEALLGSGTIGECYRSRLTIEGRVEEVVIKVIVTSKEEKLRKSLADARLVHYLLGLYEDEPEGSPHFIPHRVQARRLMDFMIRMVERELDLTVERDNADRIRPAATDPIIGMPHFVPGWTRPKAAVQTYVRGVRLDEIEDKGLREEAVRRVRNFLLSQMVIGHFHSDLQPGNIRVELEDEGRAIRRVWVLDFGQVGSMTHAERATLMGLLPPIMERDPSGTVRILEAMQEEAVPASERLITQAQAILARWDGDPEHLFPVVLELFDASHESNLLFAFPFLQALKGLTTFEAPVRLML